MDTARTSHCPHCFDALPSTPCAHCGWEPGADNPPPSLALGTLLDGRYRIGRVLGHGGFGITYLARDENLQLRLAIKEYLPRDCATRAPDGVSLAIYSGQAGEQFAYGLERFLEEARALARFDQHPGIVTVKSFFRAHGTGYCVMDYVEGLTLKHYLESQPGGRIPVDQAWRLLQPVMDALRAVHKEGLLHRDLAPDNIYVTREGRIKLLDFGAARFATGEHSRSLSIILKPGYAPEEQYRSRGKQGPWTDVYGLAATLYRAVTGTVPPEALDRLDRDELVAPSRLLGIAITPAQEAVLLKALAVKAAQRYSSIEQFRDAWVTAKTNQGDLKDTPSFGIKEPAVKQVDLESQYKLEGTPKLGDASVSPQKRNNRFGHILLSFGAAIFFLVILAAGPEDPSTERNEESEAIDSPFTPDRISDRYRPLDSDGAIIEDLTTGLQWMRCSQGQRWNGVACDGTAAKLTWDEAMRRARVLSFAGKTDWRVPEKEELLTLDYCSSGQPTTWNDTGAFCEGDFKRPTIDQAAFPNTPQMLFWSSSPHTYGSGSAWSVNFSSGSVYPYGKSFTRHVRLVRASEVIDSPLVTQSVPSLMPTEDRGATNTSHAPLSNGCPSELVELESRFTSHLNRFALTSDPSGDHAKGTLQQVLALLQSDDKCIWNGVNLTKEQIEADGLRQISNKYVELSDSAGLRSDLEDEWKWISLGLELDPTSNALRDRSLDYWQSSADEGDAVAQFFLGWTYQGRGDTQDDARAVIWYRKAAEQGDSDAQYNLGVMYLEGRGVAQDDRQAVSWFRKAAEQGNASAQTNLGWMYDEGRGVAQDDGQAVSWYRKAAEQGDAVGQYNLGLMYREGRGVAQDDGQAVSWFRKAAEQGDADAQQALDSLLGR